MNTPSPREGNLRRPHPLAVALIERLQDKPGAGVIDFGSGSGRNTAALVAAGLHVCAVPDSRVRSFAPGRRYDAALSTHALLHGTHAEIDAMLRSLCTALDPAAPLFATFASKRDTRFGHGTLVEKDVFAPESGNETGVAHVYFDEAGLRGALEPYFIIESIEERDVDRIVGEWAHEIRPQGSVHWVVCAHAT